MARSIRALLLAQLIGLCALPMVQAQPPGAQDCPDPVCGKSVLVKGRNAIAGKRAPATVDIKLPRGSSSQEAQLEIALKPVKVDPERKFIVTVTSVGGSSPQALGAFAFYPAPEKGETRNFFVDVPKAEKQGKGPMKLLISLEPLSGEKQATGAALQVMDVRLLEPKKK